MARPLWKGSISFGLVNIPVVLFPGDQRDELSFELLDDRDYGPIGYRKINKNTGAEVPPDHIARGFRLDDGRVVIVTDEDLKRASPERTQRLEIRSFVEAGQIPAQYFERPYSLEPVSGGEKGYVLLRDAMSSLKKAAVGTIVLRAREHLALLVAEGPWLRVNTLRYATELRDPKDLNGPKKTPEQLRIADKERDLARKLIEQMTEPWTPEQYHDQYREELLAAIERKASAGEGKASPEPERVAKGGKGGVIDMMALLKKSVDRAGGSKPRRGKTG